MTVTQRTGRSRSGFQTGRRPALLPDPPPPTQTQQPRGCPQRNEAEGHVSHRRGAFSGSEGSSRKPLRPKQAGGEYSLNPSGSRPKQSDVRTAPLHNEGNRDSERLSYLLD